MRIYDAQFDLWNDLHSSCTSLSVNDLHSSRTPLSVNDLHLSRTALFVPGRVRKNIDPTPVYYVNLKSQKKPSRVLGRVRKNLDPTPVFQVNCSAKKPSCSMGLKLALAQAFHAKLECECKPSPGASIPFRAKNHGGLSRPKSSEQI